MNQNDQVKSVMRSLADKLSDQQRGTARQRIAAKDEERRKYAQYRSQIQRRYHTDTTALLEEHTLTCPFCGTAHPPAVYDHPMHEGHVMIVRKERCGCEGEVEAEHQAEQEAERARRSFDCAEWVVNLSRTGLTDWLATATFDAFTPENARQAGCKRQVKDYCDALLSGNLGRRSWLVLYGNYGTGKTHLAASVLHEAMAHGLKCRFRVWPQWIESLQATFGGKGDSGAIVNELKSGQVVVLDDLDKQHTTEWVQEKLYTALNFRHNGNRPTILTFNHTPTEMEAWLGTGVSDRLMERAAACIKFEGASHRSGRTW